MLAPERKKVEAGDLVILYHGYKDLRPMVVLPGQRLQCKEGLFDHDAIIGAPYGSYVLGRPAGGSCKQQPALLVLRNTSHLWTQAVPRRTQIIYAADIAVVVQLLRLRPGSVVAEAGTGSGSLTHALAQAVAPSGKVYTFDFHEARAKEAREEFTRTGVDKVVVAGWADVCTVPSAASAVPTPAAAGEETSQQLQQGFGLPAAAVDAVFLDVPNPWSAVPNVLQVLRPNGILCTFSPCIEQTQRLCEALRTGAGAGEFLDVHTVESLTRDHQPLPRSRVGQKRPREEGNGGGSDEGENDGAAPNAGGGGQEPATKSAVASGFFPPPQYFKCNAVAKGHSAFLTFARRRLPPTAEAIARLKPCEDQ